MTTSETPPADEAATWGRGRIVIIAVCFEGFLGVVAVVIGRLAGRPLWESFQWRALSLFAGAAATIPPLAAFFVCVHLPLAPLVRIKGILQETLLPWLRPCTIVDLAWISVAAGLGEELLFRGLLQLWLADHLWLPAAIGVTSVAFGLVHAVTPTYAVLAGVISCYLGWLLWATGDLLVPAATHALYDFVALVYLLRWQKPREPAHRGEGDSIASDEVV